MIEAREFVTALYNAVLGREPDPAGLAAFTKWVEDGGPLAEAARSFVQSADS